MLIGGNRRIADLRFGGLLGDHARLDLSLPGLLGMAAGKIKDELSRRGQLLLK